MAFNTQGGLTFAVITLIIALVSYYLSCVLNAGTLVNCVGSFVDNLSNNWLNYVIQFVLSFAASGFLYEWVVKWVADTTAKVSSA
jgi:hypothetical protein